MKDIDKLKKLLTEFGVGFTVETDKEGREYIECMEGEEKIEGYSSFMTHFEFDEKGSFVLMGAWE